MRAKKRKMISCAPQYKSPLRPQCVQLRYSIISDDRVRISVRHGGYELIILQLSLEGVLSELARIHTDLAEGVPPLLASTERNEAVKEFEAITQSEGGCP